MPKLERPDGVEISWEQRGEGPLVVLASYWSGYPGVYEEMLADLAEDHRVVTLDARGTGDSTRQGPYDLETDAADLAAVIDVAGGEALVIGAANGPNQAVRVAARRPDAVHALVCFGAAPLARDAYRQGEGMLASDEVIDAFLDMLERDYRGALRTLMTATNTQMSEEELRERVQRQAVYCDHDAAVVRAREWMSDDPREAARGIGNRLRVLTSPDIAGPWLPPADRREEITKEQLPEARVEMIEGGPVSNPADAAAFVRRVGNTIEP